LIVSAGALPDVAGQSVDQATTTLADLQVTATAGAEQYHEEIPEGDVIGIDTSTNTDGIVREGGSVLLTISRGPAPVVIPNVADETRDDAVAILEELGLNVKYNPLFTPFPDSTVTGTDPVTGSSVPRGTTVNLYLQLFG
jgi:beta-lactam-binding protein with PASTA domain